MSKWNRSPKAESPSGVPLPLGKYRREVAVPHRRPKIDLQSVFNIEMFRTQFYEKPIVDDLLAHYRFEPPTPEIAKKYVGEPRLRIVGEEAVREALKNKDEIVAAGERQVRHIAEKTDIVLGVFTKVATMRKVALQSALRSLGRGLPLDLTTAHYAADAIIDMGLCLEEPVDVTRPNKKDTSESTQELRRVIEEIAPGIGTQLVSYGAYASSHPEALLDGIGIVVMESALDEQVMRIDAWTMRRDALAVTFPDAVQDMSYLDHLSLEELLKVQGGLAA